MFQALFPSPTKSCIYPASSSKCYGLYDLNKEYQSLETPTENERNGKRTRIWGHKNISYSLYTMGVYDKVPVRNIKNKLELLMSHLFIVAGGVHVPHRH